jgi:hypothetical protein
MNDHWIPLVTAGAQVDGRALSAADLDRVALNFAAEADRAVPLAVATAGEGLGVSGGWLSAVRRVGNRLEGTFKNMAESVSAALAAGQAQVSVQLKAAGEGWRLSRVTVGAPSLAEPSSLAALATFAEGDGVTVGAPQMSAREFAEAVDSANAAAEARRWGCGPSGCYSASTAANRRAASIELSKLTRARMIDKGISNYSEAAQEIHAEYPHLLRALFGEG